MDNLGYIRTAYLGMPYNEWYIAIFPEQKGPDFAIDNLGGFIAWREATPADFDETGRLIIEDEDKRKVYRA